MSKASRSRRRKKGLLPPVQKCIAHTRSGEPCKNSPILGSVVCRMHGGSAPQVRAKAAERLALAQDDAASLLIRFAHDEQVPYPVRLAAVKDILDRGGIGTKQELEVTLKPWEAAIEGILVDGDDEDETAVIEGVVIDGEVVAEYYDDSDRLPALVDDPPRHSRGQRAKAR